MGDKTIVISCVGSDASAAKAAMAAMQTLVDDRVIVHKAFLVHADLRTAADPSLSAEQDPGRVNPGRTEMSFPAPTPSIEDLLTSPDIHPSVKEVLQFFAWAHLPPEKADISRMFGELAVRLVLRITANPTLTVALRHLKAAKDDAVCASFSRRF